MTRNQIEYFKVLETQRANKAQEALTFTRDSNAYVLGAKQHTETQRHNQETEALGRAQLGETIRANQERERYNVLVLNEQQRHNVETEQEAARANRAREDETRRYNTLYLNELNRSHLAQEQETERANRAREQLTARELTETERYHRDTVGLGYSQLAEQRRANVARETENRRSNIAAEQERFRHNLVEERLTTERQAEIERSNLVGESISQQRADTEEGRLKLQQRQELRQLRQTSHDIAVEQERLELERARTKAQNFGNYAQGANNVTQAITRILNLKE